MNTLRICGLLAALALAVSAMAIPTLMGPTGQAVIPTADVAGSGLTVAADFQNFDVGNGIPVRALFGIGQNLEVGATYMLFDEDTDLDNAIAANLKFAFGNILGGRPAVGAQFMRLEDIDGDTADIIQAYLAWTHNMMLGEDDAQALAITLGANWTQIDAEGEETIDDTRFFGGIDLALSERLSVLVDYQTESSDLLDDRAMTAISARVALNRMLSMQVGTTNALGPIALDEHNFFIGLSARFGGSAE